MSLRAKRSNLVYDNYLYLLDCLVAPFLTMTGVVIFYEYITFSSGTNLAHLFVRSIMPVGVILSDYPVLPGRHADLPLL
jgi:hypothetical protein